MCLIGTGLRPIEQARALRALMIPNKRIIIWGAVLASNSCDDTKRSLIFSHALLAIYYIL